MNTVKKCNVAKQKSQCNHLYGGVNDTPQRRVALPMKWLLCGLLAASTALLMLGCSSGPSGFSWDEEVTFLSGETIIIKRSVQVGKSFGELGGPGGWSPSEMTLEIEKTAYPNRPPVWRSAYVPMLIDYDAETNAWFVIATFYSCQAWYDLGRPDLPYIEYRAQLGQWVVVPLEPKFFGRAANLLTGVHSGGEPPLVTLKYKKEQDGRAAKKYKRVVDKWTTGC